MCFLKINVSTTVLVLAILLFSCVNVYSNNQQIENPDTVVTYIVSQDGAGDFASIQAAVNAIPDYRKVRTIIYIKNGIYKEKLTLPASKELVTFRGENVRKTVITNGDWAQKQTNLGENTGTSGSSTCFVFGHDFCAENITFQNTAGPIGQAVAVLVGADRCVFNNCRFLGFQDTLYTYAENSRQYYKNCYIEGSTDFIFGKATAVFDDCEIHSLRESYITAAATHESTKFGYLFYKCRLTAESDVHKVYLGRPWRDYAKVVFRECEMGAHIRPEGWHNWKKPQAEKTTFYAEYRNAGPGADVSKRVKWSYLLNKKQAAEWTVENVLKGNDNWNPQNSVLK